MTPFEIRARKERRARTVFMLKDAIDCVAIFGTLLALLHATA